MSEVEDILGWIKIPIERQQARIEQLEREVKRLRGALKYYASTHKYPNDGPWGADSTDFGTVARTALQETGVEE